MRSLFRFVSLSLLAAACPIAVGCGGDGSAVRAGVGGITITAFAPAAIPGGVPTPFTITGTNLETVTGTQAQVIFHALGGATPFEGGTVDTATVVGDVTTDTTITGLTPAAAVCGVASITFEVTVVLESGVRSNAFSAGVGGLTITAPTVTGVTPSSIPCINVPATIQIDGTGFGPLGGTATVRFVSDAGTLFGDGTLPEATATGTILSAIAISVAPPRATICGPTSATASISVTLDASGSCSLAAAGALTYDAPSVTAFATVGTGGGSNLARQTITNFFSLVGTGFGPPGGAPSATVRFISLGGLVFEGGTNQFADVPASILNATTIQGNTPLATSTAPFQANVQVLFEDGTCTPTFGPVTFVPPPVVTAFVNTRAPFQQGAPGAFNANRCLACLSTPVQVNGANFQAGAVTQIFATAVGPTQPIGAGTLLPPLPPLTATQILGNSPTDASLTGLTQATVRVTNPDGQVGTLTPVLFSTLDVLPNVNASVQAGNNAEMNIAVNPTNPRNAVVCSHNGPTLAQMFTAFTTDAGATWTTVLVGSAQDGQSATAFRGDPMCAADAFGNFYIGYLEFDPAGVGSQQRILVLQSADGGATWINPRAINAIPTPGGNGLDRCEIGVGLALGGGATDQAVYVAYHNFVSNRIEINGFRSTGLGNLAAAGFGLATASGAAPSGDNFHHPAVAVGPHGEVYVSFMQRNFNTAPTNIWITVDPDGLGSGALGFTPATLVTSSFAPNIRITGPNGYPKPQPTRGYAVVPSIEVVQTGPFAGRVVIAYDDRFFNDAFPGDEVNFGLRILTRFSDSLGATWSSPVQAHVLDTRHQWQPWLASDPLTGNLYLTWYDSVADVANNRAVQRFSAVSSDGAGWVNPLLLSQTASDVASGSDGADYLEYEGVAAVGGCVYACWCQFNPGNGDVFASPYQQDP